MDGDLTSEESNRLLKGGGNFTFKDIVKMDDRSIQEMLREVESQDLARALKSEGEVQDKIFRNMSKRGMTILKDNIEYMGPVSLKNVEESQRKILSIIRRMADIGMIFLSGSYRKPETLETIILDTGGIVKSEKASFDNKHIELIPPEPSLSPLGFANAYYTLVETLIRLTVKARSEGLLAIEEDLDDMAGDDFFKKGLRLVIDGSDGKVILNILELLIRQEHDFYRKRLMEIAAEGILSIQAGDHLSILVIKLNSMAGIENNPIDAACTKYFSGDTSAFLNIDFKAAIQPEKIREEVSFITRALHISEKARQTSLLSLENELDYEGIARRDVFEFGLPLLVDNCDYEYINTVLSNLAAHETNPAQKNFALAKKDAILSIKNGDNTRLLIWKLCAYFDKNIERTVKDILNIL